MTICYILFLQPAITIGILPPVTSKKHGQSAFYNQNFTHTN